MKFDKVTLTPEGGEVVAGAYKRKFDVKRALSTVGGDDKAVLGLMPPAVRWISGDRMRWIVEKPPVVMPVTYVATNKYSAAGITNRELLYIPVPWQTYYVNMQDHYPSVQVLFSNTQIREEKHDLCYMALPNLSANGAVCMPETAYSEYPNWVQGSKPTLSERVMWLINSFWMSGFNNNMYPSVTVPTEWGKKMALKSFMAKLEKSTLEEVLNLTWPKVTTVKALMAETRTGMDPYQRLATAAWQAQTK